MTNNTATCKYCEKILFYNFATNQYYCGFCRGVNSVDTNKNTEKTTKNKDCGCGRKNRKK